MARRPITQELVDGLVTGFRESPGNASHAARVAKCDPRTARKAWEVGWPNCVFLSGKSIERLFQEEAQAARALLQREDEQKRAMAQKERDEARKQAIEARKQEGQIVTLARTSCLQALTVASQLNSGARLLAGFIKLRLDAELAKKDNDPTKMQPEVVVQWLGKISSITSNIIQTAHQAMVMERLHLGEPTDIIGLQAIRDDMAMEEAEARLLAAQQAFENARKTPEERTAIGMDMAPQPN